MSVNDVVILCNSQYCEASVQFVLPQGNLPERINLRYKATLFQPEVRQRLVNTAVISGPLLYSDGVVRRL